MKPNIAQQLAEWRADPLTFFRFMFEAFGYELADFQRQRFQSIAPALLAVARGEKPAIGRYFWEAIKGASKDSDIGLCILWLLLFTTRPLLMQGCADDFDQASEVLKAIKTWLHRVPLIAEKIDVQTRRIVCEATESVCEIITSDASSAHGSRPDVLLINELSHISSREFAENAMDNADKVPNGLRIIASNAGFLETWPHEWRQLAIESPQWSFHRVDRPAPWIDETAMAEARRRNSPTRFARLWQGVWVPQNAGDALNPEDIEAAIRNPGPFPGLMPGFVFLLSLDLGIKKDHSALVALAADPMQGEIHLASVDSWKPPRPGAQVDLEAVKQTCLKRAQQFQAPLCYDPWQAEYMAQTLRAAGIGTYAVHPTPVVQDRMAQCLVTMFSDRKIVLYREPDLIRDLGRLTIKERLQGLRLTAARDEYGHADRGFAFAQGLPLAIDMNNATVESWQEGGRAA